MASPGCRSSAKCALQAADAPGNVRSGNLVHVAESRARGALGLDQKPLVFGIELVEIHGELPRRKGERTSLSATGAYKSVLPAMVSIWHAPSLDC